MDRDDPIEPNPEAIVYRKRVRENLYRSLSTDTFRDADSVEEPDSFDLMTATAGFQSLSTRPGPVGWTDDMLDEIPESVRYEIEDGNLRVTPQPIPWHQDAGFVVTAALREHCPRELIALYECEIRVKNDDGFIVQRRIPDVMVLPRALRERNAPRGWIKPDEVPVAAEIVSSGSKVADRITKVGVYAEWGIGLYLRIEREPSVALYEYRLDPESKTYRTPVEHTDVFETEDPYPIRIDLGALH
ncbi:Uma2 family endonuclease [Cryptosporangium japonicum]|uniref:Putative restriction endonuclease domain-containing protein n=1 Tax=Cryptosporangium japonicum TaxID=80872 RepID=A0ABN0UAA6_9ACTN